MFRRLSFGSIRGIPITASGSWLVVVFVLTWVLGDHLADITTASQTAATLFAALTVLLFFASVVAHELGHAFVALRSGLKVDGIELWMFGGFARLRDAPRTPGEQFKIAAAGPLVTLVLTAVLLGVNFAANDASFDALRGNGRIDPWLAMTGYLGILNLAVLILNLLPAYPLDGGVLARAIAWKITGDPHKATRWAATAGLVIGGALVGAGVFLLLTTEAQADGFAIALLGWLVSIAARGSLDSARRQERLDLVTVGAIADPTVSAVDGHHTILRATDDGGPPGKWVVVRRPDGPPALLSTAAIDEAMAKGQPALTLAELADEVADRTVPGDTSLRDAAVDPRLRDGGPLLALSSDGEPLGIVTGNSLRQAVVLAARGR